MYLHLHVYYLRLGGIEKQAFAFGIIAYENIVWHSNTACRNSGKQFQVS